VETKTEEMCREGCGRPVKILFHALCGTCYQRTWRAANAERLPKYVEERYAFPYREWLATLETRYNVVHCKTRLRRVGDDDVYTAPLCDTDAQLIPSPTFRIKPRACKRCVAILKRHGLVEDWLALNT
jgi:hypothetical protein